MAVLSAPLLNLLNRLIFSSRLDLIGSYSRMCGWHFTAFLGLGWPIKYYEPGIEKSPTIIVTAA
ncbi:MAG: hypothetical protein NTX52_06775 [Planctomycetota bacterium]|nr:hypothetical protein [Planctomycetota bacterium]